MFYDFPVIKTLDDVLPAIKDSPEFIVADREDHFIVNYVVNFPTSFPPVETVNDAIRRECRGIMFNVDGEIISRPLHKFFNIGERPETLPNVVDISQPHSILDKVDGSFIRPVVISGKLRWCTKMGITDVGLNAEEFAYKKTKYLDFGYWCCERNLTAIFEWVSRKNRIVVDYPTDNLILLAVRNNITGKYLQFDASKSF